MKIVKIAKICVKSLLLIMGLTLMLIVIVPAPNNSELERNIPVLMYHHLLTKEENVLFQDNSCVLDVEDFEKHMEYLRENGFHSLTASEVQDFEYNYNTIPAKSVWITFDDGYYSNILYAYPILKKYGLRATIFVVTSYVTNDTKEEEERHNPDELIYLNWYEMSAYGDVFDFASHTDNMHYLNSDNIPPLQTETAENITSDVKKSFSYSEIDTKYAFSYPYGMYSETAKECVKNLGVQIAVTVNEGYLTVKTDPMEIPRFNIYRDIPMSEFINILSKSK